MTAKVTNVENHKNGQVYVNVHSPYGWKKFKTCWDANLYLLYLKSEIEDAIVVEWKDIVITPKKEFAYETRYAL